MLQTIVGSVVSAVIAGLLLKWLIREKPPREPPPSRGGIHIGDVTHVTHK